MDKITADRASLTLFAGSIEQALGGVASVHAICSETTNFSHVSADKLVADVPPFICAYPR